MTGYADGIAFLAGVVATRGLHGVGPGATPDEVTRALGGGFLDVEEAGTLRRDYGFVELYFSGGPGWVMTGGSFELHRLAADDRGMADDWRRHTGVAFPEYCSWAALRERLSRTPGAPGLVPHPQGGYVEYRAPGHTVSVVVVDDEEEERDDWPGHGDVWSVSFA